MLKNQKIVQLTASSEIGGEVAVNFSATINSDTDVNTAYSEVVVNTDLYNANKVEVRKDVSEFRNLIYKSEDELFAENEPVAPVGLKATEPETKK